MIATVAEEAIATGNEPVISSPGVSLGHNFTEMNQQDDNQNNKEQLPSFCETNNKSNETVSRTYTDVEDTTFQKQMNDISEIDEEGNNSSYLDLLLTAYLPLIFLWFRRSMFGHANLIRTLVVGQVMRLVFLDNINEWISEKIPPWLEVILFQTSSSSSTMKGASMGSGKIDPHAWPPPAFKALAMLTVFALVVHPDGLTWVFLGKLRDAIYTFFAALGQSLEFLLNDYGVFPTIIAATTLAAMFFLVFVVIRTLTPKKGKNRHHSDKHNNTLHNERKKKKKKGGNARHRNNHHNHRSNNRIKSSLSSRPQPHIVNEHIENDSTSEASPCSLIPSPPPVEAPNDDDALSSPSLPTEHNTMDSSSLEVHSLSATTSSGITDNNTQSNKEPVKEVVSDKAPTLIAGLNKSTTTAKVNNKSRRRVTSASTADTTPLSDDQSCGSISVRSFPSVSVHSNRSGNGSLGKKSKGSTPRRLKRHGTVKSPKNAERNSGKKNTSNTNYNNTAVESSGTSRWDALKPDNGNAGKSNNNNNYSAYGHHNNSNGTPGSKKKANQRHRGNNSRRNTNGRKGRQYSKSLAHNEEPTVLPGSLRGQSNTNELSQIGAMRHDSKAASPNNPFAHSTSPSLSNPPPGFTVSRHEFETKASDSQYRRQQHHVDHDLLAAPLFETPLAMRSPQNNNSNSVAGVSPEFFEGSDSAARMIQENPFRSNVQAISGASIIDNNRSYHYQQQANRDSQIEADLQELGGQMAGSILDF